MDRERSDGTQHRPEQGVETSGGMAGMQDREQWRRTVEAAVSQNGALEMMTK